MTSDDRTRITLGFTGTRSSGCGCSDTESSEALSESSRLAVSAWPLPSQPAVQPFCLPWGHSLGSSEKTPIHKMHPWSDADYILS
ncbi:hypothetical protein E2C01_015823 [Portunus trituberculatus]|uniref:Uncharacterized protein n=1 Tax=Portunus trituberculatus TaxID=210409 RepID=A0A5B7DPF0_PORTR|nr:hypothetical protein [Portunus trituberculatus]